MKASAKNSIYRFLRDRDSANDLIIALAFYVVFLIFSVMFFGVKFLIVGLILTVAFFYLFLCIFDMVIKEIDDYINSLKP